MGSACSTPLEPTTPSLWSSWKVKVKVLAIVQAGPSVGVRHDARGYRASSLSIEGSGSIRTALT